MALEDRRYERTQLDYENTDECFHIEVYDQRYVLNRVHDVSVSGTGIQISNAIEPGTPVKLVFRSGDHTVSVNGTTVWCAPIPLGLETSTAEPAYRTGIQFDTKDRNCSMFFMAMRDFIIGHPQVSNHHGNTAS
ncbi:PilZ domain-containing protein [Nitrosomonas sp.]|uniref:PilZ domain-containing protein n=1 Tax=Nitrosomonas sp. TaxID=42353 RepID=UPI001DA78BD4|nr:PilZ domain-containing protein [Nitrosomonas sp.]MCB1950266.1 hypothetical protein [Nitrosomonas sp.]